MLGFYGVSVYSKFPHIKTINRKRDEQLMSNKDNREFEAVIFPILTAKPISSTELMEMFPQFRTARAVQRQVERERKHGYKILTKQGEGYFVSSDPVLNRRCLMENLARAFHTISSMKPIREFLQQVPGQQKIDLDTIAAQLETTIKNLEKSEETAQ